ncbi:methyltransferase [Sphingomonas oleivorans]|uniref:Methyltransferase n=1 Tax=Sphingomonas oleivorans TaxID=1735121 RepID=A0A2T5FVY4_9SPHN|nr:class I SAM-dependent methyltransferase [Sphingomonas oleivorans]PTQ09932.1 methyltransferase [Sphingomonas oleivorans]
MRQPFFLAALLASAALPAALASAQADPHAAHAGHGARSAHQALAAAIADPRRSEANRARDRYRHPMETLRFFEVEPGQTIAEFYPGGGWYSEILAPFVKGKGRYVAIAPASPRGQEAAAKLLADRKDWFGETMLTALDTGASSIGINGTVDRLLTFRNIHNLLMAGGDVPQNSFKAFYAALKPGGILGVVDHRLPETSDSALEKSSGYIKRSTVIRLAEAAGFKFVGESPVNANPKDTHDWPEGVWTLPPTLRLGETDKAKYLAIGESDRMTLKFVKPAT